MIKPSEETAAAAARKTEQKWQADKIRELVAYPFGE